MSEGFCSVSDISEAEEAYPSRPAILPRVTLGGRKGDLAACTKSYTNNSTNSPSIFTVQCACNIPKLLGVSVMGSNEGETTALNSILTRLSRIPKTICYEID